MSARLVQQKDAGSAEDGACQTDELLVAVTQYVASIFQLEVQFVRKLLNY